MNRYSNLKIELWFNEIQKLSEVYHVALELHYKGRIMFINEVKIDFVASYIYINGFILAFLAVFSLLAMIVLAE